MTSGNSPRIKWSDSDSTSSKGRVGGITLFNIGWGTYRGARGWILRQRFPGMPEVVGHFADKDAARNAAEDALVAFVARLGAKF